MKDLSKLTLKQLANEYNSLAADLGRPTITKFSDRESGLRRTEALQAEKKPAPGKKADGRGRPATFAGKQLTATVTENPRQPGSFGWHSMKIIIEAPGIVYEDFLKAGGRNNDLRWDVARDRVVAS